MSSNRRSFLKAGAGAGISLLCPGTVSCYVRPGEKKGLNVLFLMTDEQHYRSLSLTGNRYIKTPHMDRIGREGALFLNATCVTPYCSPSRASIITGVYPHTHGILRNVNPRRGNQAPLKQNAFTNTETELYKHGYVTRHRGKWHLGDKRNFNCYESRWYAAKTYREYMEFLDKHLPASRFKGISSPGKYYGRPVVMTPRVEKGWRRFHAIPGNRLAYIATIGRTVIPPELLPDTQVTNQVLELIEQNADRNFMITASWIPPHDLWVIPDPYYSMVDRSAVRLKGSPEVPAWDRRGPSKRLGEVMGPEGIREYAAIYHGMVKYIDDQVGRVLAKLDELDLTERTLVVFTSDHGDMVGAHGCIGKSIFSFYDDLVRIPLLMRLPGKIRPGTVVSEPVSQIDLMPTILHYTGLPVPRNIHGRSLRPLLEGRSIPWRDYAFCQRAEIGRMLRTSRYKYFFRPRPRVVALYDLKNDPNEDHNIAAERAAAATVRLMHRRLLSIMARDGDPYAKLYPKDPLA